MQRIACKPRENWKGIVENLGIDFHSNGDKKPYWNESAYYSFTLEEVERIEDATNTLEGLCLELVDDVVKKNKFHMLKLSDYAAHLIKTSWDMQEKQLYGRFDFSIGKDGSIKMLEYNADTPTSLFEAAVAQWQWLKDAHPEADQFNSIHERLIDAWQYMETVDPVYFACLKENSEDILTTSYIQDTAHQAGLETQFIHVEDIGLMESILVDMENEPIDNIFKLYPWEWMLTDKFAPSITSSRFIEPAWKMILSNKAMLPLLYEMFPDCPYLLESHFTPKPVEVSEMMEPVYVRKPYLSREGANITIMDGHGMVTQSTPGEYDGPYIFQRYHETVKFLDGQDAVTPIIGSWVVAGESAGMGIREDYGVTTNMASFVPHIIKG